MSQRAQQVGSTIQRGVQEVLTRGLNDPRVRGLVTVTRVEVTPDLAEAVVYLSVLPEEHAALTMHGIEHARGHVQSRVGRALALRRPPRLSFRLDSTLKRQIELEAAMTALRLERDAAGEGPPAAGTVEGATT